MIRLRYIALALLILALCLSGTTALARVNVTDPIVSPNVPTSGDLINSPARWDGKTITFTGEAITEVMERGDHAWIHINDDAYYLKNVEEGAALGGYNSGHAVWLPLELAEKIGTYGDYRHEGDVVTVKGTFNAACGQHGGDMDIHATSLTVDVPGRPVVDPIHPTKGLVAVLMIVLAAVLWWANRRVSHRERYGLA